MVCRLYFKIEREREEHLKPRLQLLPPTVPKSPEAPPPPQEVEEEEEEEVRREVEEEEEDYEQEEEDSREAKLPPKMQSTLRPVDNDASSVSDDDDNSSNVPYEDNIPQPVYGPAKEENTKMGFSSLKLGMLSRSLSIYW